MENKPPLRQKVTEDKTLMLLNEESSVKIPKDLMLKGHDNHGNYIISLSELCQWMGEQAETLGVDIFPGFAGKELLLGEEGEVKGVVSGQFGVDKQGR